MKNKIATLILGLLVMAVWGAIFFKIFYSVDENDSLSFTESNNFDKVPYNDYTVIDTTHLLLNYRDPFGISFNLYKPEVKNYLFSKNYSPALNTVQIRSSIAQNRIKYSGYIRNVGSKQLISMLNINGKDVMMVEGETIEKVKLLRNLKDSVKIIYQGKTSTIAINFSP